MQSDDSPVPKNLSEEKLNSVISVQSNPGDQAIAQEIPATGWQPSQHATYVRDLALTIFDYTRSLHDLGESSRTMLGAVALLCDLSLQRGKKNPLRAANKLIRERSTGEFSPEQLGVMAAILALQHGDIKKKHLGSLDLSPMQQREVLTLASLLMIADGLDHSNKQSTHIQQFEPTPNKMWVVVDGPDAEVDSAAAQHNALLWENAGYPRVKFLEAGEAQRKLLPYPEPMETMGLLPADPLVEAGRKVMRFHFAEMLRHEAGTRQGVDIEALHDMRVATRRLRAAFEVFNDAFEPRSLKGHLAGLRATGRALGGVRDLDVFMEKAQKYIEAAPEADRQGLQSLLDAWAAQRESARSEMLKHLDSQDYLTFKRKFNVFLSTPGAGARPLAIDRPTPNQVHELVPCLIYSRLASVLSFDSFLEDAPIERLHALRIEFKKLRYTVEYFREVLGAESKPLIEELKRIQDHLGDLNDAQVASQIVQDFIDSAAKRRQEIPEGQDSSAVAAYLAFRQEELANLITTFPKAWERFMDPEFRRKLAAAISVL